MYKDLWSYGVRKVGFKALVVKLNGLVVTRLYCKVVCEKKQMETICTALNEATTVPRKFPINCPLFI